MSRNGRWVNDVAPSASVADQISSRPRSADFNHGDGVGRRVASVVWNGRGTSPELADASSARHP